MNKNIFSKLSSSRNPLMIFVQNFHREIRINSSQRRKTFKVTMSRHLCSVNRNVVYVFREFVAQQKLFTMKMDRFRSSPPEMFLCKCVLSLYIEFTGEHPCQSAISIKQQSNLIEITLRHGCSPENLLHIFRTLFPKNNYGGLPLQIYRCKSSLS